MTEQEFNKQVSKIESLLIGFSIKLTGNKDSAKDLMQETLLRSYKNKDKFTMGTNFKAWMTTIMYNSYINIYRRKKTKNKVMRPLDDHSYMVEKDANGSDANSVILMKELHEIIETLSEDFKVPFKMLLDGYHYDEISEMIDTPMGTVKSRIFYARKKIQKAMQSRYDLSTLRAA